MGNIKNNTLVFLTLFVSAFLIFNNYRVSQSMIIGEWIGNNKIYELSIVFIEDNTCKISIYNKHTFQGSEIYGEYEIDYSKRPIPLKIKKIKQLNHPLYSIFDLMSKDSMRFSYFSPHWKLRNINYESDSYIDLIRVVE